MFTIFSEITELNYKDTCMTDWGFLVKRFNPNIVHFDDTIHILEELQFLPEMKPICANIETSLQDTKDRSNVEAELTYICVVP